MKIEIKISILPVNVIDHGSEPRLIASWNFSAHL